MLSQMTNRMLKILKALTSTNGYTTSNVLGFELGVTAKTIRTDVKELNGFLKDYGVTIDSKRGFGYTLDYNSLVNSKQILHSIEMAQTSFDSNPITSEERVRYIVKELLYAEEDITIEQFMNDLFVSESTVKKDLQNVKNVLNTYNIKVRKTNNGLYASGHEVNKRFCISDYLIYGNKIEENMIINLYHFRFADIDIQKIKEIILYQLNQEEMKISDDVLTKITVHIAIAIGRIKTNQYIRLAEEQFDNLTNEEEYKISKKIVSAIEDLFGLSFSEEETAYITLHLIGNRIAHKNSDPTFHVSVFLGEDIYQLSIQILDETAEWLNVSYLMKDEELIYDLGLHVKQLLHRLDFKMNIRNPLLNKIKIKYPLAFEAGVIAAKVISSITGYRVNENEIGFLALHVGSAMERQPFHQVTTKRKVALVCASGMATSELLLIKLSHELNNDYCMIGAYALHQLDELMGQKPDIILTTVAINKELDIPVIEVDPVLNDRDIIRVKNNLEKMETENAAFSQYLKEDLYFPYLQCETKQETLEVLTNHMMERGYIHDEVKQSILSRESISPTAIGNMVAIPHPMTASVSHSCICIGMLDKPVAWSEAEQVSMVFMIVLDENLKPKFQQIFSALYEVVNSSEKMDMLRKQTNYHDFLTMIELT